MWNPYYHWWEFRLCYSCVGLASQYCAENGGSCCNSRENDEEDDDGFVYSGSRYNGLRYNEADIFTVSPPLLHDVQAVLGCLLSRIRQYCDVQQSVSLRGWWIVPLGDADTVYSVNTVYLSISGSLCSISDLVHANSREVWRNTEAAYGFVASCRVLANNASLHSSRLLCWFRLPFNIVCGLNSLLYLPPSSGQPRGVSSVAAEEEHERGDSAYHTWG